MTENEAIDILGEFQTDKPILEMIYGKCHDEALKTAISALEEIQKYREIGTDEYFKECADILNKAESNKLAKIIDEWILYYKIGTVEECREAREKQRAKKSTNKRYEEEDFEYVGGCPCCGNLVGEEWTYCFKCGQKLDWSKP